MIDAMFQSGTDKALDDQVQRPIPKAPPTNTFSFTQFLKAPAKGVGAGFAETIAFGSEVAGAFGQVLGAYPEMLGGPLTPEQVKQSDAARQKLLTTGIDYSNEAGDLFRARAKEIMPDPETAHTSENVAAGLFRFGTKAVGYTVSGGFVPGAALLGFDEGLTEADRLKQQGVDIDTRTTAGAVAGAVAGGSVLIPMTGPTAAARFVKGVAVGEGTMIGQAVAERAILANAGYDKIADTFDPFDPVSLAVGLVPGALGAKFGRPAAKRVEPLKTEADVRTAAVLDSSEQTRSDAFERSAANLRELEVAVKAEKDPGKRLLLVDELEKQRSAARENFVKDQMRAEPDLEPAARVRQVVDALDQSRLTPDSDLRGAALHQEAIETAHEQMARGEPVAVSVRLPEALPDRLEIGETYPVGIKGGEQVTLERVALQGPNEVVAAPGWVYNADEVNQRIIARNEAGKEVGSIDFMPGFTAVMSEVDPAWRRRGIGTALYDAAERHGADFSRDPVKMGTVSADALALREYRNSRNGPARTAAAATELRAIREAAQNPVDVDAGRIAQGEGNSGSQLAGGAAADLRGESAGAPTPPSSASRAAGESGSDGAAAGAAASDKAAAQVAALNPDTLVMLDGMESPVRVGDLLAKIKEEAAQDAQLAKLVQVAAECALTA